jgi:ABC-type transport system involved in multi-copper enzyme maturation permease subunit
MELALRQTKALFLDAYRELNARKLFWVTLVLSVLVVTVFATIGVKDNRVTLLWWTLDVPMPGVRGVPATFYKSMFIGFGVKFWLAWAAMILALVSSSSIFPDFLGSGAIELVLSKPISRTRIFLTKYATGLLFSAIQVGVFSLACFILIGVRGHSWEPRLFLAIPIVTAIFSFLFCVCTLLGILTRSTIASLLLTLLVWFMVFIVNAVDGVTLFQSTKNEVQRERLPARIVQWEKAAATAYEARVKADREKAIENAAANGTAIDTLPKPEDPIPDPTPEQLNDGYPQLAQARKQLSSVEENAPYWKIARTIVRGVKFSLPKTQETTGLLDRNLLEPGIWTPEEEQNDMSDVASFFMPSDMREVRKRLEAKQRADPLWWILGTSFAFEGVILSIAAWLFARKEF